MIFETERLILRPWLETDAEECYKYAKEPAVGLRCGWAPHTSVEDSRQTIKSVLSKPETYAMVLKETGLAVGSIGLRLQTHRKMAENEAELGFWLGVPYWGRGLVPEAARVLIRHGFCDLGLNRIWCAYFDGNDRSKRVQEKLGFKYCKTVENDPVPNLNEVRTTHFNVMTKEDWQKIEA